MNNEWLNNLRSRMQDHEEDVPDRLWNDIRDELFSEDDKENKMSGFVPQELQHEDEVEKVDSKPDHRRLFYRISGVAAAAILCFFMTKLIPHAEQNNNSSLHSGMTKGKSGNPLKGSGNKKNPFTEGISSYGTMAGNNLKDDLKIHTDCTVADHEDIIHSVFKIKNTEKVFSQEFPIAQNLLPVKEIVSDPVQPKEISDVFVYRENQQEKQYADHKKSKPAKSWMLSMLTGNATSNAAEQQFPGYASISGKPMNIAEVWSASSYHDDPLTELLLANQSQPVEARIRHKVPVTLGLSLYYNLGKKWGIGTGLNYTKLTSELHSGSENNYIKGIQSVHYIGIPVQVNYNVIQKGRFTGYITGGALVEKSVSGSLTTTYVVNDEVKETSKESLDNKKLQFSVNTAAGLQLKIIDKLGIYAEPGIGYHFKDDNALNTVYKEKPLQFNIKFGIRLLLD
ncbi:outer membrane beta-barrel protein [Chryseobacterium sp.]|uniref:outer membrane beta-barrel protein n=1 Tax=Chryseobacterium sp. TaxID=1871047 RepID=UPI0025BC767D|nr:outer membrane beta-barrel protein [Chryseobacterium sp.]MBV8326989.1 PorT family protein [Chryseobacterium sp.]